MSEKPDEKEASTPNKGSHGINGPWVIEGKFDENDLAKIHQAIKDGPKDRTPGPLKSLVCTCPNGRVRRGNPDCLMHRIHR